MRLVQWILVFALPSGVLFARACQCGKGWDHVLKHCYQFYTTTNETWTSTKRKCEGIQATLPVLKTQQDLSQFALLVTKYANTTDDQTIPVDGRQLDNTTWVTDNTAGSQHYAYYTKVKGRTELKEGTDGVGMNWEMKICQRMCPESNNADNAPTPTPPTPLTTTTHDGDDSAGTNVVIVLLVICGLAIITLLVLVGLYFRKGGGDDEPTHIPDMLSQTGKPELDNIKTADLFTGAPGTASYLSIPPATNTKQSKASPKGSSSFHEEVERTAHPAAVKAPAAAATRTNW